MLKELSDAATTDASTQHLSCCLNTGIDKDHEREWYHFNSAKDLEPAAIHDLIASHSYDPALQVCPQEQLRLYLTVQALLLNLHLLSSICFSIETILSCAMKHVLPNADLHVQDNINTLALFS